MCGIIFALNKKKKAVNQLVINQYQDQFSRGQRGFGIIRINQESCEIDRATEPYKFLIDLYQKESSAIIAHHRTPTSTENKISQTHPIIVSNEKLSFDYLFVHNGIINNAEEIKKEHETFGFKYKTELEKETKEESEYSNYYYSRSNFNDSESLAVEMALFIEKKIKEIRTKGSLAFVAIQIEKKTQKPIQIFFGRNDNPLNILKDKELLFLSSEGPGKAIKESVIFSFSINDKKMKFTERKMTFKKEKEKEEETKPLLSPWQKDHQEKNEEIIVSNNKKKTEEIVFDEYEEYFKDSIKNRSVEEIEDAQEEAIEYLELEIMELIAELRKQLESTRGIKTGEYKGRICSNLDEMKKVIIASQAELAVAREKDSKDTAQEFINWRKENNCPSRAETLGQQKLTRFGF